jgi:hypothetical protein
LAIYRSGMNVTATWFSSADALRASPAGFGLEPMTCSITHGASLLDRCDGDEASHTLCMLTTGPEVAPDIVPMLDRLVPRPSAEIYRRATTAQDFIGYRIENDGALIDYYYGEFDGRVWLLAVDVSKDCVP